MNIETTCRPSLAQTGFAGGEAAPAEAAGAGRLPTQEATLTVREAADAPATGAARRLDAVDEADALKPDRLDELIKSVLDFPPPAMPDLT